MRPRGGSACGVLVGARSGRYKNPGRKCTIAVCLKACRICRSTAKIALLLPLPSGPSAATNNPAGCRQRRKRRDTSAHIADGRMPTFRCNAVRMRGNSLQPWSNHRIPRHSQAIELRMNVRKNVGSFALRRQDRGANVASDALLDAQSTVPYRSS